MQKIEMHNKIIFLLIQKRGRVYEIGSRLIEINFDVLDMLKKWNSHGGSGENDFLNDTTLDFPFILSVLLSILSPDNIQTGEFNHEAVVFLTGEFEKENYKF